MNDLKKKSHLFSIIGVHHGIKRYAVLAALFVIVQTTGLSQPWSEGLGAAERIYPTNANRAVVIKPDYNPLYPPFFNRELLQILSGGVGTSPITLHPIIRLSDLNGGVGRLGINSQEVMNDPVYSMNPLLMPYTDPGVQRNPGDLVLSTERRSSDQWNNPLQPNPIQNANQNLFIHSAAPNGRLVLSNENPEAGLQATPRLLIHPKGQALFQSNWTPNQMVGAPLDWNPVADIQFGKRSFMYYWTTLEFSYNKFYDQLSGSHKRVDGGVGCASMSMNDLGVIFNAYKDEGSGTNISTDMQYAMIFNNKGNLSLGTWADSDPDRSYKLSVEGNAAFKGLVKAKEVRVSVNGWWPDYVFEKSYNLLPLHEVEEFISKNGHLPGVIPAKEAETTGIEVGEMQAKLLEKVEELTLYMIDLKKENQMLQKRLNEMEATHEKR